MSEDTQHADFQRLRTAGAMVHACMHACKSRLQGTHGLCLMQFMVFAPLDVVSDDSCAGWPCMLEDTWPLAMHV